MESHTISFLFAKEDTKPLCRSIAGEEPGNPQISRIFPPFGRLDAANCPASSPIFWLSAPMKVV